ncbi:hypothetical protein BC828DRAFT_103644 [Blastocladiella britannica]|nr:hypothetical protein BC828DRAFT_103644 [Blastocladiella britannica]
MSKKHTPRPPITEALDADPVSDLTAAEWMVSAARRDSSALSAATTGKLKVAVTPKYQLLAIFDDVCTHVMLDSMYLGFRTRKMTFEHPVQGAPFGILSRTIRESPNSLVVDREEIARIVRRAAAGTIGSYTAAHAIIVSIPWLRRWCESLLLIPESIQFLQHLRRYVEMYDRDAKFDIVRCGRFTPSGHGGSMPANGNSRADSRLGVSSTGGDMLPATSPDLPPPACDAMLVANRDLPAHSSLTLCTALLAPVTSEVSDAIDDTLTDFSMIHSKELGECLLAGPLRFANHDCKPNCRYSGGDRMHRTMSLVTLSAVAAGEPLVVDYSTNYFGPGNVDCLCASCEKAGTSGFGSQQVRDAQRAAAIPSDGQSRYVGTLDDGRTPSSDDTASDSGSSSRGARVNPPRQAAPRAVGSLSVIPMPSTSLSDKLTSSANRHLDRHGISREAAIALVDATDAAQMPRHGPLLPHAVPCSECKLKAYGFQVTAQGMVVCDKCLRHVLIYGAKWPETNTSHASNRHGRIAQAKRVIDLDYVRTCARKAASASTTTTGTPFLASASPVLRSSRDSSDDATFPLPETEVMFVPKSSSGRDPRGGNMLAPDADSPKSVPQAGVSV